MRFGTVPQCSALELSALRRFLGTNAGRKREIVEPRGTHLSNIDYAKDVQKLARLIKR